MAPKNKQFIKRWLVFFVATICIIIWIIWDSICFFLLDIESWKAKQLDAIEILNAQINDDNQSIIYNKLEIKDSNSIVFLKTFKTAGSTITSIFHNYCVLHNKSCPITKPYFLSKTWDFYQSVDRDNIYKLKTWNNKTGLNRHNLFDMWINHAIFHPFLFKIMPSAKEEIVTIIRNPIDRFISAFRYYSRKQRIFNKINISSYIKQLYINYTKYGQYQDNNLPLPHIGYQTNSQCRSLIPGYVQMEKRDIYNVWNKYINNGKWLILITERFDESLLVLKYKYNLSFTDLIYTRQKGRANRQLHKDAYNPNQFERKLIETINECDSKLYSIATKILNHRIYEIYGNDIQQREGDLNILQQINSRHRLRCNQLKRDIIDTKNMKHHGLNDMQQYIFYKTVYCKSLNRDNIEWNKWAHNYVYNETWRKHLVSRVLNRDLS